MLYESHPESSAWGTLISLPVSYPCNVCLYAYSVGKGNDRQTTVVPSPRLRIAWARPMMVKGTCRNLCHIVIPFYLHYNHTCTYGHNC